MKNKSTIIWLVLLIPALGLLLWVGGKNRAALPVNSQIESGSALTLGATNYDFGTISMKNGNVGTSFTVANNTDKSVRVDSIVTSCMCTTAYIVKGGEKKGPYGMPGHGETVPKANEVLEPGQMVVIDVVFDPAAHGPLGVGPAVRDIYLVDENGGALKFEFKAMVTL